MRRCQADTSARLLGACSQSIMRCQATANRPGRFSKGCDKPALSASVGVGESQYWLASAERRLVYAECDSEGVDRIETLSRAPICSWNALRVLRKLRANHKPATRKTTCTRRLPSAYQLISVQELNSIMFPCLGRDQPKVASGKDERNWQQVQETIRCISPAPLFFRLQNHRKIWRKRRVAHSTKRLVRLSSVALKARSELHVFD